MSGMTSERLDVLRWIAQAATQRTWAVYDPHDRGEEYLIVTGTGERIVLAVINKWARTIGALDTAQADAQHIATFDPPTVLALLDEIERLRRELETLAAAVMAWEEYRNAALGSIAEVEAVAKLREAHTKALAQLQGRGEEGRGC